MASLFSVRLTCNKAVGADFRGFILGSRSVSASSSSHKDLLGDQGLDVNHVSDFARKVHEFRHLDEFLQDVES